MPMHLTEQFRSTVICALQVRVDSSSSSEGAMVHQCILLLVWLATQVSVLILEQQVMLRSLCCMVISVLDGEFKPVGVLGSSQSERRTGILLLT